MVNKISYRVVCNRSRRLNKDGKALIEIECRQGDRRKYFTTHIHVEPQNFQNGFIVNVLNADGLNYAIYKIRNDLEFIELEYIKNNQEISLAMLKESYKMHATPSAKLRDFGLEVISQSDKSHSTKLNYKTMFNDVEKFRKNTLIQDINYQFIISYEKWMRDNNISQNTIISRLRLLKAILNEAKKLHVISANPFENYKIKQMIPKKGYLKKEELLKLEQIELSSKEDLIRDAFLVGCYTGLRFSDIVSLRQSDITDGWLHKKMVKTKLSVDVPVKELFNGKLYNLIEKYNNDIGYLTKHLPSNSTTNKILRDIFDKLEIPQEIKFHSSRHTFATLLAQGNVSLPTIQKLLGHTKLQTTQIYSEMDKETILNAIKQEEN